MASVAQALASRTVQSVPIDPATGMPVTDAVAQALANYPQLAPRPGFGPPPGTKGARGRSIDTANSMSEPWPGAYDQSMAQNGVLPTSAYSPLDDPGAGVSQAYVNGVGAPGMNQSTGPMIAETPASRAIAEILVRGGNQAPQQTMQPGMFGRSTAQPMVWEPAVSSGPAPAAGVDPWARDRMGSQTRTSAIPGMVTGNRPGATPAVAPRLSAELHARLMAQQDPTYKARAAADFAKGFMSLGTDFYSKDELKRQRTGEAAALKAAKVPIKRFVDPDKKK